ncbi:hypothetical protein [Hymenobacter chitinivorans]|uniref:Uncharacterized protein n=1 Tax=Hymenobacter chitinivorans DSM 11115 TaxID=1121954 RepID=A0A2M9BRH7_9BACT|nr:hypothetical protein [Hymenobacter chitinivorans]PJJ60547.1 hypothetical protein CLV45_1976 [Hymenobacter chitinivorans DSM 11115]
MTIRLLALLLFLNLTSHAQTPEPTAPTQPDPLTPLIKEREMLIRQYEEASAQRNAFLANKPSKKDLEEVVDALKGIIRKDTEIVKALKESSIRRTATIVAEKTQAERQIVVARGDQSMTRERFYDLENQIQNLQIRDKQREKKLQEAQAAATEAEGARQSRELIAAGLAGLSILLLWYIFKLRGQARPAPRRSARR